MGFPKKLIDEDFHKFSYNNELVGAWKQTKENESTVFILRDSLGDEYIIIDMLKIEGSDMDSQDILRSIAWQYLNKKSKGIV